MTVRTHMFNEFEFMTDPWIYILAVLLGLALFFTLCAAKVQGDVPTVLHAETNVKISQPVVIPHNMKRNHAATQLWTGDISDISNERAAKAFDRAQVRKLNHASAALPPSFVSP